jgi:hypothetical protein
MSGEFDEVASLAARISASSLFVTLGVQRSNDSSIVRIARTSSRVGTRTMVNDARYGAFAAMLPHRADRGGGVQLT